MINYSKIKVNTAIKTLRKIGGKTPLKHIYRWARRSYRNIFFRKSMRKIMADPQVSLTDLKLIADLAYGWGNPSHASDIDFYADCANYAAQSRLPILECGSGITTVIAGLVAQKYGNTVWSLENMKSWYKRVKHFLDEYKIDSVKISHAPLNDYGEFSWYAPPLESMPAKFSLVICDGPPSEIKGGRYGLIPVMRQRLAPGCIILFHNAIWEKEQANVARWAKEINMSCETRGTKMPYYVIKIAG